MTSDPARGEDGAAIGLNPVEPPSTGGFWTRSATRSAIGTTIGAGLLFAHAAIRHTMPSVDALDVVIDAVVGSWAFAFGLHATSDPSAFKKTP